MKTIILFVLLCLAPILSRPPILSPCQTMQQQCPPNQIFDTRTCRCICQTFCPKGFYQDPITCECTPKCPFQLQCPPEQQWSQDLCKCICLKKPVCPKGQWWDQDLCKCICIKQSICPMNSIWSQDQCRCVCKETFICTPPYIFSQKACKCMKNIKG